MTLLTTDKDFLAVRGLGMLDVFVLDGSSGLVLP